MDRAGNITRKLSRAVLKDSVIVPDNGYTIVRFYADNPGNLTRPLTVFPLAST